MKIQQRQQLYQDTFTNLSFVIKAIKARGKPYQGGGKRCNLCLSEKTCIAMHDPKLLINKRSELLKKCTCKFYFELRNVKR